MCLLVCKSHSLISDKDMVTKRKKFGSRSKNNVISHYKNSLFFYSHNGKWITFVIKTGSKIRQAKYFRDFCLFDKTIWEKTFGVLKSSPNFFYHKQTKIDDFISKVFCLPDFWSSFDHRSDHKSDPEVIHLPLWL